MSGAGAAHHAVADVDVHLTGLRAMRTAPTKSVREWGSGGQEVYEYIGGAQSLTLFPRGWYTLLEIRVDTLFQVRQKR